MTAEIRCESCRTAIPPESWNRDGGVRCQICGTELWARVFPAVLVRKQGSGAEAVGSETDAGCFFHPQSKAAVACDGCGRFLCGLCDLEVRGEHLCSICLQQGAGAARETVTDNRRVLYDSIVLALALIGPMIFVWPSLITGPLSVMLAIWYWNRPKSIVPRTRVRFILAIVLGLTQTLLWIGLFWAISTARNRGAVGGP